MQQCCEGFRMTNLYSQPVTAVYSHHFCAFPTDYDEVSDVYSHAGRRLSMSFCVFHNCISIPFIEGYSFQPVQVGNDSKALPIVLQLIGCPWEEATLLHVATAFEVQFA
ncbi:unnamed protein product [Sphagnum jensenii]|uniref:Uncharacterized protein n=1 Tax=Sphagnum jensenii TaxID=128206 RepID=A0ABP1ALY3_9BRYO